MSDETEKGMKVVIGEEDGTKKKKDGLVDLGMPHYLTLLRCFLCGDFEFDIFFTVGYLALSLSLSFAMERGGV